MGNYLETPIKDKEASFNDSCGGYIAGGSGMQGWRKTMEDAHLAKFNISVSPNVSIFGVFDGHGGSEVAKFTERHLIEYLLENANFKKQ